MQIVILAGGFATRLKPLSNNLPKSLVPINGIPFIYHQLDRLINEGFSRFVFCLGNLNELIVEYLDSLKDWRKNFVYSIEKQPLGTGGAIINAIHLLDDDFLVINGDNIFLGNYNDAINDYYSSNMRSLVIVRKVNNNGNIILDETSNLILKYSRNCNKCIYEDMGIKLFNKKIFEIFLSRSNISLEEEIYKMLIDKKLLNGKPDTSRVLDVGTFEQIAETEYFFMKSGN